MKKILLSAVLLTFAACAFGQLRYSVTGDYKKASAQGMTISGDTAYLFGVGGLCRVYDLASGTLVRDFMLGCAGEKTHVNSASFGVEIPQGSDSPALYIGEWTDQGRIFVEKLTDEGSEWIQTITVTDKGEGLRIMTCAVDAENGFLYGISRSLEVLDEAGSVENTVNKYRLPALSEGREVTLTEDDLIDRYSFVFPNILQGSKVRGGYMYIVTGFDQRSTAKGAGRAVKVIDLQAKTIRDVDLTFVTTNEPEDMDFYGETPLLYTGQTGGLYEFSLDECTTALEQASAAKVAAIERERVMRRDSVLALISGAQISDNEILITKCGAKGDGVTDCKPAFDKAMKQAEKKGGARIVVPAGEYYLKGPITFVSNVCLDLAEGATLRFSGEPDDFLPVVYTSWEATFLYNYSPLIYGRGLHDVAITGKGTIDGGVMPVFGPWVKTQAQALTREMNHNETPVEERIFGDGYMLRPQLLQFLECTDITVEGVHITNSPFWCVHLVKCENAICRGLSYEAELVNNDGVDPEYSRNVLIENIDFDNGDDNVAIKAGRDNDGWNTAIPTEGIIVRNCTFGGVSGVAIGSEMSAGVRNVFIENCTFKDFVRTGIHLKTNPDRGGFIRNVYVTNCSFGGVTRLFWVNNNYAGEGSDNNHFATIENIYVNGLSCSEARYGIQIQGTVANPVRNVVIRNVRIGASPSPVTVENTLSADLNAIYVGDLPVE